LQAYQHFKDFKSIYDCPQVGLRQATEYSGLSKDFNNFRQSRKTCNNKIHARNI